MGRKSSKKNGMLSFLPGMQELADLSLVLADSFTRNGELGSATKFLYIAKNYHKNNKGELSRCLDLLRQAADHTGNWQRALHFARGCYQLNRAEARQDDPDSLHRLGVSAAHLGSLHHKLFQYTKALPILQEALDVLIELLLANKHHNGYLQSIGMTYEFIGTYHMDRGPIESAYRSYTYSHDIALELLAADADNITFQESKARASKNIGKYFYRVGNMYDAAMLLIDSIYIIDKLCARFPNDVYYRKFRCQLMIDEAALQLHNNAHQKCMTSFANAIMEGEQLMAGSTGDIELALRTAFCYEQIGLLFELNKQDNNAMICLHEFNNIAERLYTARANHPEVMLIMGRSNKLLGTRYLNSGFHTDAMEYFSRMWCVYEILCRRYPKDINFKRELAIASEAIGKMFKWQKKWTKSMDSLLTAARLYEEVRNANPDNEDDKKAHKISEVLCYITWVEMGDHAGFIPAPVKQFFRTISVNVRLFAERTLKLKPKPNALLEFWEK